MSMISSRSTTRLVALGVVFLCFLHHPCNAFSISLTRGSPSSSRLYSSTKSSTSSSSSTDKRNNDIALVAAQVEQLKKVLSKEYASFFDPMERDYYAPDVTFDDPLTSIAGIDGYQNNVDMLASRTILGKLLFKDAGIVLHSIEGGDVQNSNDDGSLSISQITTRWTLRLTAKVLPWSPTARFTGISVYNVKCGGKNGVIIVKQSDYWDSINILPGGTYRAVDKTVAIADFLNQLKPNGINAPTASEAELPYQLLRRGNGYDVRRYPSYTAVQLKYTRRDEAFATLGSCCKSAGVRPLAPAIMNVDTNKAKTMMWPLFFAAPGQAQPPSLSSSLDSSACETVVVPERVVAVSTFSDASVEPLVRKVDRELREACTRDGLVVSSSSVEQLQFAQYDAIFSMGKRRGEVWIDLPREGHPW